MHPSLFGMMTADSQNLEQYDMLVLQCVWENRFQDGVFDTTIEHQTGIPVNNITIALQRLAQRGFVERFGTQYGNFAWRFVGRTDETFNKVLSKYRGFVNEG